MVILSGCWVWFVYAFKDMFCFNGWFSIKFFHQVNIGEVIEAVNKYCCAEITLCCRSPPVSWYESWCWSDRLIIAYNFTWVGRCPKMFLVICSLSLRCFRRNLPHAHPLHIGAATLASSLGIITGLESIFSLWKLRCSSFFMYSGQPYLFAANCFHSRIF